jgi:tricarballylate dehydrogenase
MTGERVVVVGAGNAALVAALAARDHGAPVTVLEAATRAERGGNSRFAGATFRFAHAGLRSLEPLLADDARDLIACSAVEPYTEDDFHRDLMETSSGRADPELTGILVEESYDTVRWMRDKGVRWELATRKFVSEDRLSAAEPYVLPPGGAVRVRHEGIGLMDNLFTAVEATDIDVWYEAPAHALLTAGSTVEGGRGRRPDGYVDVTGQVILACGGFEASPEMRLRYLGAGWDLVKVRGTRFNKGVMLEEALRAGAQAVGHWGGCHATPVSWDAPDVGDLALTDSTGRHSYPYGILVNARGERFVDEGEQYYLQTYAKTGAAIRAQPRAWAAQIFDQKTLTHLQPRYSTQEPVTGDSIEELEARLGIPAGRLQRTVEDFNTSVPEDPSGFDPLVEDGLATKGVEPPKSIDESWSWDEFIDIARRIKEEGLAEYGFAMNWGGGSPYRWLPFLYQNGGRLLGDDLKTPKIDSPAGIEALAWTQQWFTDELVPPSTTSKSDEEVEPLFANGTIGMMLNGDWVLPAVGDLFGNDDEWGVTYMPRRVEMASDLGGNGLCVTSDSQYPEEAADVLKFLGEEANMEYELRDYLATEFAGVIKKLANS